MYSQSVTVSLCDIFNTSSIVFTCQIPAVCSRNQFDYPEMTHLPPVAVFDEALWDVPETLAYLHARSYKRVALQLPDHLLLNAPALAAAIQKGLAADSKVCGARADWQFVKDTTDI